MVANNSVITTLTKNAGEMEHIYVNGDSNSQGLLPAPLCEWNFKIGIGESTEKPWPFVMGNTLNELGVPVNIENISESGRRLVGKSHNKEETLSLGAKDGRVALQQMIGTIFNKHGIKSENVYIYINLGTNDLQDYRITKEYLQGSMIKHILTILMNPSVQYRLCKNIKASAKDAVISSLESLTKYMSDDISKSYILDVPVTHVQASSTETRNHGDTFDKLIKENMETFRELFSMISWKIIITSPVLVKGHPFNAFSSAVLSKHWPSIVQNVVNLFNLKNISWIPDAQGFSIPSQNEFGGSLHLTPEGHLEYGQKMARHFILNKRASKLLSLLTDAVGNSFESGARHTEEVGQAPIHLHAFESSKKRSPSVSSLIQVIAEYAVDDISFTIK